MKANIQKDPLRRAILGVILIASTGLTVFIYITFNNLHTFVTSRSQEKVTLSVLKNTEVLLMSLVDLETGYRGYLIARDSSFLDIYQRARTAIPDQMQALRQTDPGDIIQKGRILLLLQDAGDNLKISQHLLKQYGNGSRDRADDLKDLIAAKEIMDMTRFHALQIEDKERTNLHKFNKERSELENKTLQTFILLAAIIVLYLLITYFIIRQNLNKRNEAEQQLLESRHTLHALFQESPLGYMAFNPATGIIQHSNKQLELLLGNTQLNGTSVSKLEIFKSEEEYRNFLETLRNKNIIKNYEAVYQPDQLIHLHLSLNAEQIQLEGESTVLMAINDITSLKHQEEHIIKLNEGLEHKIAARTAEILDYKFALDASSIVLFTDLHGIIKYANENFVSISGYSQEELIGNNIRLINSGYHPPAFFKNLWATILSGKIWKGEIRNRAKDGRLYWVDTTIIPFLDENKKPIQFLSIRYDITDKKRDAENLVKSEANLSTILANANTSYVLFDLNNKIVTYNPKADYFLSRHFGRKVNKEESFLQHFPIERRIVFAGIIEKVKAGETVSYDIDYPSGNGDKVWYNTRFTGIKNEKNELFAIMMQTTETTEQKKNEHYRERITRNLIARNRDLEQFTYIVSHNLRAPVANIMGLSDYLINNKVDEDQLQTINNGIHSSVQRLDAVIRDLNTILHSKRDSNDHKEKINLDYTVDHIKELLKDEIEQSQASIRCNFHECNTIESVKPLVESILLNLISNSIKYARREIHPEIEIMTRTDKNELMLLLTDNGRGIDLNKKRDEVFGLYKRFHPEIEGKGMGLYMVKTQVESLHGKIEIESSVNQGTRFKITLPQ